MDIADWNEMSRDDAAKRALWPSDMEEVLTAVRRIMDVGGLTGAVTYHREHDGAELAVIWWDNETCQWLVSWLFNNGPTKDAPS